MLRARVDDGEAGFTLVEVLVAFVISAVMLGAILLAVERAGTRSRDVALQAEALVLARSSVETFVMAPYRPGEREGRAGRLSWRAVEDLARADPRGLAGLARLRLTISDDNGRRLLAIERLQLKSMTVS
ncbi:MAG: prepilin-type N-terminal cleavage/methylation domain-containing protein [Sphingopyxis sp.]|nr:prepilin-type N-terminal cleavage/methylation domain-containing protein [Sphingopyxis sp.]